MSSILVLAYLITVGVRLWLSVINVRHRRRHGGNVPPEFSGSIEPATLGKISAYNADLEAFGHVHLIGSTIITVAFLFGGGLSYYDHLVKRLVLSPVGQGVVFFTGLGILSSLIELPFDVYSTFRIEQTHGFNRTTPQLFVTDWLKSTLLSTLLLALISSIALFLFYVTKSYYWLCFWGVAVALTVLLMLVSPYVIEPLFIKTKPLEKESLAEAVRTLGNQAGVTVNRVLQVDASRRSTHSNAYFTGIGRVKRVVLFDTLLERLTDTEILAVLGHELGHWKLRHVTQRLLTSALYFLVALFVASRLLAWDGFTDWVGYPDASLGAKVIVLAFVGSLIGFVTTPLSSFWSRRHERQADDFAATLTGNSRPLATALIKMAKDNLSNLHPHAWYAAFYYSHPPIVSRVRGLLERGHNEP